MTEDWNLFKERYQDLIPDFDAFLAHLEKPLPIGLREGAFHCLPYGLQKKLENLGIDFHKPFEELNYFEVQGERKAWGGDLDHHLGLFFMQALSSLLPVLALNPKKGEMVLDMCAAPGGKSIFLAEKMENEGKLVCCEPDVFRRRVLKGNLNKMGVLNSFIFAGKAQDLPLPLESFDKILLDGPCSSEGTFRREVLSGKKRREVNFLNYNSDFREKIYKEQSEILDKGYEMLRPGGTLVYSTCTYDPRENEGAVDRFLKKYSDCKVVPLNFSPEIEKRLVSGFLNKGSFDPGLAETRRVYPHYFNSIGFYVAKIVKSSRS